MLVEHSAADAQKDPGDEPVPHDSSQAGSLRSRKCEAEGNVTVRAK